MIDLFSLVKLINLKAYNDYTTINVLDSRSVLLDQVKKDLFTDKPFWFGISSNHSFIYMELENIDTNVFLYNNDKAASIAITDLFQVVHSSALTLSGIEYSPKTIWELFTSEHADMRELCNITLKNALDYTKKHIKNELEKTTT
jgi:thioredoxin-related protein